MPCVLLSLHGQLGIQESLNALEHVRQRKASGAQTVGNLLWPSSQARGYPRVRFKDSDLREFVATAQNATPEAVPPRISEYGLQIFGEPHERTSVAA